MDALSLFGLFAVTAMLACYALEDRSRGYILGFAGACALGSAYGFLQGAWPFGLVEGGLGHRRAAPLERQAAMTSPFLARQEIKPCSALYWCAPRRWMKRVSTRDWAALSL